MFNVYWGDRFLATYEKKKETPFLTFCAANGIPCEYRSGAEEYVVFPVLNGVTVALSSLNANNKNAQEVAKQLSESLSPWGALVVFLHRDLKNLGLIKILKVQILLALEESADRQETGKLRFFYSLRQKKESLAIIASIAKQLLKSRTGITMEISTICDVVKNLKYIKYYFCNVPTVLIEIAGLDVFQLENLERALLNGILERYGSISPEEQSTKIKRLQEYMEEQEQEQANEAAEEEMPDPGESRDTKKEEFDYSVNERETQSKEDIMSQQRRQPGHKNQAQPETNGWKVSGDSPVERGKNKKRHYGKQTSALFPPGDGPVYQFEASQKNNVLQSASLLAIVDRENVVSSFNDEIRKTAEWIVRQGGCISKQNAGENESVSNSDDEHII
ncbi:MAG: hypothetical protein QHH10_03370 [Peptococcaceae bacterium]|jgi:hypothetical protein|nr:hypothetical protein [Peptococcaceae bacterium]MDH7524337.1 hypothetical protein [Peptococcaceae bacterium]